MLTAAQLTALDPYPGRNTLPWRCRCNRCGHEVRPSYANLQRGQGGCGYCAGTMVDPAAAADLMRAAGVDPQTPYPGRNTAPWPAICRSCGRAVRPTYSNVKKGQGACKFCAARGVVPEEAAAVMIAAGAQPSAPYPGAGAPWPCQCVVCGHAITPSYSNVRNGQGPCGFCAGTAISPAEATKLMREADLTPLDPYPGMANPWRSRCDRCTRQVTPRLHNIRNGQGPCKFCAQVAVDPDEAQRRMLEVGLRPLLPYSRSGARWPSECLRCGQDVAPRYDEIVAGGGGCRFCAPNAATDPLTARTAMENAGLIVLSDYPGAHQPWLCECATCHANVQPSYARIRDGRAPCRHCAGLLVDLEAAAQIMRAAHLEPLDGFPGSGVPWRCVCQLCGREVTPRYSNVRLRGHGCIYCASWGFDYDGPAALYLIADADRGVRKIGIAGSGSGRLAAWVRRGWTIERTWQFTRGVDAHRVEQQVLTWWRRDLGAAAFLESEDGWTETVAAARVDACAVIEFVEDATTTTGS